MNTQSKHLVPAIILSALTAFVPSCTDDSKGGDGGGLGDASSGGTPGTGGAATGGAATGGAATGGTAADGAVVDASDASDGSADGSPDGGALPGCGDQMNDSGTYGSSFSGVLLVGATDYTSTTKVDAITLSTGALAGSSTYADGDAVPDSSGGVGFVLERGNGALNVLTQAGTVAHRVLLQTADGGAGSNPHDVLVIPGSSPRKAYVSLYGGNAIAVVDVDAGTVTGTIDLSGFQAAGDTDGTVEVDSSLFDATTGRAYFVLDRIDQNTAFQTPGYLLECPAEPGLIVAVDPATDTLVDLNGSDAGTGGYALGLVSHGALVQDPGSGNALAIAAGCFATTDGGSPRSKQGVESIDLQTGAVTTILAPSTENYLNFVEILAPGSALIQSFDANYATLWNAWSTSSATLGAAYDCVPEGAEAVDPDVVIGANFWGLDARVVAHRLSTGTNVTVSVYRAAPGSSPFYPAGTALVK